LNGKPAHFDPSQFSNSVSIRASKADHVQQLAQLSIKRITLADSRSTKVFDGPACYWCATDFASVE
jgi:hypothetical protein